MKHLAAFVALFLGLALPAQAHDMTTVGDITVAKAWSRASAGPAKTGAAFMAITSKGGADRLIGVATAAAGRAELHTHLMEAGIMKMRQVPAIDIPAGGMVMLQPGGLHVMLFNLAQPFKEGDHYMLTLTFEKAGKADVMVMVGGAGAMRGMDHGAMDQGTMKKPQ